jgi:hypothetical protein
MREGVPQQDCESGCRTSIPAFEHLDQSFSGFGEHEVGRASGEECSLDPSFRLLYFFEDIA